MKISLFSRGRQRSRREGSEGSEGGGSTASWFRFRERSEQSDGGASSSTGDPAAAAAAAASTRWAFRKQREKSHGSTDTRPPSADDKSESGGITRGSLRFNVPRRSTAALSPDKECAGLSSPPPIISTSSADPPRRNAESGRVIDSVIYSPASSARGTPSSEMFFGSGNTTPSFVTSPPPNQSGFSSPSFSPPISPPPLQPTHFGRQPPRLGVLDPEVRKIGAGAGVSGAADQLILQPVPTNAKKLTPEPDKLRPSTMSTATTSRMSRFTPATSTRTTASTSISSAALTSATRTSTSIPSTTTTRPSPTTSMSDCRSKTDNLERLISDIDSETATPRATPSREVKKYVRRRYTDSRHPTTELPDVRLEVPENMSVQYPPVRRQQKMSALATAEDEK